MPKGLVNSSEKNPLNFTRAEWQQAKRAGHDPRQLKSMFQECWAISDARQAFAHALEARGYYLAKGDRRGFAALDYKGEVYTVSKWAGIRTKEVKIKLGSPQDLPSVRATKQRIAEKISVRLEQYIDETLQEAEKAKISLERKRKAYVSRYRDERAQLLAKVKARWEDETKQRAARLPRGVGGIWGRITGSYNKIRSQNDQEAKSARVSSTSIVRIM